MALISREEDRKDLEERTKNNGRRPNANDEALGCMFHINRNCGCSKCRGLKARIYQSN